MLLVSGRASAELKLDGRWKQSALREDFAVQQWLEDGCGRPPESSSTGGGEVVNVRLEGDELAFVGGGRVYRTNQCYDPMPTLARQTHSREADGKTWRTRCTTPPTDPRKAVLNTLVVVTTPSHIDLVETGRYEITLESGRCIADVKRTRSYTLVADDDTAPAATSTTKPAAKEPEATTTATCGAPGEPSKLEVRPSKKLLRTGESFKFRALVLDARGCETRTTTTWKIAPESEGKGLAVDAAGRVSVANDASEGSAEIIATAAGKDTRVVVEIVSPARYDELLARSGLNAAGENDEVSSVTIASETIGAGEGRVEDRSRERRLIFVAIIGAVLLMLGVVTIALVKRSRRAKALIHEATERHEARVAEVLDRRRRREAEHAEQMRAHQQSVAATRAAVERAKSSAPPAQYGPSRVEMERSAVAVSRGKICPTCGERFEGGAEFCGKDGTVLVLLN